MDYWVDVNRLYFDWLYGVVAPEDDTKTYVKLLSYLHSVSFNYTIPMDSNRRGDGENLRYRFGVRYNIDDHIIANELDVTQCSILEMMVALAIRCEESFMHNPDIGDRTKQWFWMMIDNLGLSDMYDGNFDEEYVKGQLDIFINREYDHDGNGGLFHVTNSPKDMRSIEIWVQMMLFLNTIIEY